MSASSLVRRWLCSTVKASRIVFFQSAATQIPVRHWGPIARGAIFSVAIRLTSLTLGFAQAVLTARLLGPEGYGVVAVALSVATIAATLATMGLGPLAVREIAQLRERSDWSHLRGFLRFTTLGVLALSSILATGIASLAFVTPLFGANFQHAVGLAVPLIPLLALLAVFRGQSQGFGHVITAQAAGEVIRPIFIVMSLGLLLATGSSVTTRGYIGITVVAALVGAIGAIIMVRRIVTRHLPSAPTITALRDWSLAAMPFLGVTILGVVGTEANTLLLGGIAGPTEAGLFQPIARIAPILLIATEAISIPLGPRLAQLWERGDIEGVRHLFRQATLAATMGTIGLAIVLLVMAPLILGAFGRPFLVNQHLLLWIALAQIFNASFGMSALLLAMAGRMKLRILCQSFTMLVQIGTGLLFIGPYGASGATAALVAAVLTWSLTHWVIVRNTLGIDTSLLALIQRRTIGDSGK